MAERNNPWVRRLLAVLLPLLPVAAAAVLGAALLGSAAQSRAAYAGRTLLITELCAKNLTGIQDANGNHGDWIEITNVSGQDIDLSGWHLSNSKKDLERYTFPEGFALPGTGDNIVVLWADEQDGVDASGGQHLSFALNGSGGTLYLTDADGTLVDEMDFPDQKWDVTFGRKKNSVDRTGFFAAATPGAENPASFLEEWERKNLDAAVEFGRAAGMYEAGFDLSLTTEDPNAMILYTLDGSDPIDGGTPYQAPVSIRDHSGDPNKYVTQHSVNDISPLWIQYGVEEVAKCTVVKARAYQDGRWGPLCVSTYWVGCGAHTLPVVSVSAAPEALFGADGFYTSGSTYYTARKYGMEIEAPGNNTSGQEIGATIEIFGTDGVRTLADTAQIHISGEGSRSLSLQKSLNIDLDNSAYAMTIDGVEYELSEFTLRGSGCGGTYLSSYQDGFLGNYLNRYGAQDLGAQYNVPVVLYLEGEYWGIYMIREKKNADLMQRHYDVEWKELTYLGGDSITEEAAAQAAELMARIESLDCANPEDLAWVEATFDMDNIISYMVCNLFTNNFDGALVPNHNVILWKTNYTEEGNPYADGRWRALINDLDVTFVDPENRAVPAENRLKNLIEDGDSYGGAYTMIPKMLVHHLWGSEEFRLRFVSACVEELQTTYSTDTLLAALEEWRAALAPEVGANLSRQAADASGWAWLYRRLYGEDVPEFHVTAEDWNWIMEELAGYIAQRGEALTGDLWAYCGEEMQQIAAF